MPIESLGIGTRAVSVSVVLLAGRRGARIPWNVSEVLSVGAADLQPAFTRGDSR